MTTELARAKYELKRQSEDTGANGTPEGDPTATMASTEEGEAR